MSNSSDTKKQMLKEMIRQLHSGTPPQQVKERFKQILATVTPLEISNIEQELIQEGMPREEIHRLCDVHMLVFQEQLGPQRSGRPTENPVNILMEEHKIMLQLLEMATSIATKLQKARSEREVAEDLEHLKHISEDFVDSEKHYLREENVLFPMLEKHGVTEPPAIMWTEHNQIRPTKKEFCNLIANYKNQSFQDFRANLDKNVKALNQLLSNHFFKENNILFPTAQQVITEEEWIQIRKNFAEIGYCRFTPQYLVAKPQAEAEKQPQLQPLPTPEGTLQFDTGTILKPEVESLLRTLPFDVTFVDKDDTVRYFNKSEIFLRTKAVIGRKVQQCHPQKSVHIVNRILNSFKSGKNDVAEFWIPLKERFVHIRYFAVRDKEGKYLGTMEVTQDVTDIKKLEGEKRLLNWKD